MAKIAETPLMSQYAEMKRKHPDAILLFRVGDFYETFADDAITASDILGITLTKRANGSASSVPLAGFPHHALDTYLPKLVRAGKRVAICEQLEDPKLTKKLVKRGITELVTPGVNTNDSSIPANRNNFLAGVHFDERGRNNTAGVAFLDITTGEFLCAQGDINFINKLISNIAPKELLHISGKRSLFRQLFQYQKNVFELEDWVYTTEAANTRLLQQFNTSSLKGFGIEDAPMAVIAAGSLLHYLDLTGHTQTSHIASISRIDENVNMHLDRFTIRNLELVSPLGDEGWSLTRVLDKTSGPMGARTLAKWVLFPLLDRKQISKRHDAVESLLKNRELRLELSSLIREMRDMARFAGRISSMRCGPSDLIQLARSISHGENARQLMLKSDSEPIRNLGQRITDMRPLFSRIATIINPDAPNDISRGGVVNEGVNPKLDELRHLLTHSKEALNNIVDRESSETGITSLKQGYNRVFGYYLEVRNTHKDRVPTTWIRKQTLTSAERYITPELKEYEQRILTANEQIEKIEREIFDTLRNEVLSQTAEVITNANVFGETDALLSFATVAEDYNYVRPQLDDSKGLEITEGRHPVIERRLPPGEPYVANSVALDPDHRQIMMITGPNMSGKSALLRQTAIIVLMAQIGSFVPAQSARIGIVDKIFTRVGASDNISSGESTFMVEMNEAASILNNMSERSLILFDELGRGTSTYDGISLARAIVEHIHNNKKCHPKTLFATHYHELNEMEKDFPRIVNYNVSVKEINGRVVFVRKLERGGSEHSFGIHVARLAGIPKSIINRADAILHHLESSARENGVNPAANIPDTTTQLSLFQLDDPLLSQIRDRILTLDINNLTPLMALSTLHDLKSLLTGK